MGHRVKSGKDIWGVQRGAPQQGPFLGWGGGVHLAGLTLALVPWCPGALVPWCPGALASW